MFNHSKVKLLQVRWRLGCNSTFSCGHQFHLWVFSTHTTNYINLFQGQSDSIFVLSSAQHVRCKNLTNIKDLFISNHAQKYQNSKLATHLWSKMSKNNHFWEKLTVSVKFSN